MKTGYDLSEKIVLLVNISGRRDTEEAQKKEYESKIKECLDEFDGSITAYEQPIVLITKALEYTDGNRYSSIMDSLLKMPKKELAAFLTSEFKKSITQTIKSLTDAKQEKVKKI
ncbi:hypothetical protein [Listeria grandensis]|nr:hypothetical protein [Listeria grandensis]